MKCDKDQRQDTPDFSVLIGLVSTEDRDRILETLEALRNQKGSHGYEVIIADRRNDDVSRRIGTDYPEVRLLSCPASQSLPELRTIALRRASGQYIIVTEDHCVPSQDWFDNISKAFTKAPDQTVAVGGCVENGVCDTPLDWATFFCEYSAFLEPVAEGVTKALPGMNVAYRRSAFVDLDDELLMRGFWETTVHPALLANGMKFFSTNDIKLFHSKKFSFRLFARQRLIYSRYYGGLRFSGDQRLQRALAFCGTVLLPPLLLYRITSQITARRRLGRELVAALPMLSLFVVIWAFGEMVGYLLGQGGALSEIE